MLKRKIVIAFRILAIIVLIVSVAGAIFSNDVEPFLLLFNVCGLLFATSLFIDGIIDKKKNLIKIGGALGIFTYVIPHIMKSLIK